MIAFLGFLRVQHLVKKGEFLHKKAESGAHGGADGLSFELDGGQRRGRIHFGHGTIFLKSLINRIYGLVLPCFGVEQTFFSFLIAHSAK
jgi:hypothetical protein